MRVVRVSARMFFFAALLTGAGCELGPAEPPADGGRNLHSPYVSYAAEEIDIGPLTCFIPGGAAGGTSRIKVYVSLLDSFGSQIKSPGLFRFELYGRVAHAGEAKGRRVLMREIDLTDAVKNNGNWRDYLRAYEFSLEFGPQAGQEYILQVTCFCPSGRRLSDDFTLGYPR